VNQMMDENIIFYQHQELNFGNHEGRLILSLLSDFCHMPFKNLSKNTSSKKASTIKSHKINISKCGSDVSLLVPGKLPVFKKID